MPDLVVSVDDYRYFVERAVTGMAGILTELGDELACASGQIPPPTPATGCSPTASA